MRFAVFSPCRYELDRCELRRPSLFVSLRSGIALLLAMFLLQISVSAGIDDKRDKKVEQDEVEVKNFGQVNGHIYRGGQPEDDGYAELAALGIKTVIDLRDDAKSRARKLVERNGMRYINIKLDDRTPPTLEESDQFLKLVNDQANWPVYVHCAGGRHRTGVLVAIYRMEMDSWGAEQAYREMKQFKFYSSWGHGDMKDYVYEYFRLMHERRAQIAAPASAPPPRARRFVEGNDR